VSTQACLRVVATNGYFGAVYATSLFTVDNVPPVFDDASFAASPLSSVGDYAVITDELALAWSAATDTPACNTTNLTYCVTDAVSNDTAAASTNLVAQTFATLSLAGRLDATHVFRVFARDPAGTPATH
jgi:hypothetical protein